MNHQPPILNTLGLVKQLKREPAEHKGDAGKVVLIGGAPGMAGALLLAGNACLHLGAGWTILEMLDPASAHADDNQPELMIRLASANFQEVLKATHPDVIAIGPGLGKSELASQYLHEALTSTIIPLVIDADAINLISESDELLACLKKRNRNYPGLTVITPHPGEAAKLLKSVSENVQSDRGAAIQQLVELTQSIVVLKGQHTLIASPIYSPVKCLAGNPGMGTGGMGDVLTGTIAAISAQGLHHHLDLWQATGVAVELHATAADSLVAKGVGPIGLTPSETILEMRSLLNKLL
ncbi:NAD(P)H-hydrate dehydratase [Polynucleobacter sp. Ross1-W9]|uniref:NAD(P)H-hydrate dehydratase n=1 Tax=Polynucleobacter parvulilacunae TaxID=1855631 RepID=UPI001C0D2AE0|nr:NAD(P)H-hydrate dehydratase [Polynucleobacter parvulilacunae]MBU3557516.1 NAD(P)H-hydrate dehydratase [Polynucleobacter parvulilacunae]